MYPEEAMLFFGNMIRVMTDVFKDTKRIFASMLCTMLPGSPSVEKVIEAMIKTESVMLGEYMADRSTRDKKAFNIIDANKDGSLQLEEFLLLFSDLNRNKEFMIALGFGEEAYMAKLAEVSAGVVAPREPQWLPPDKYTFEGKEVLKVWMMCSMCGMK